jgi:CelD/BcsL family acetyltransferase involved in cellulose biosynthesis
LLAPEWNRLAGSIPDVRFLHLPCWYRAYLSSQQCDAADVWFVAAYRGSQLVAVFPLQIQSHQVAFLKPRFLGTIEDDELQLSDFVFARTPDNASLFHDLTAWLRNDRPFSWDVLRLLNVPGDSSIAFAASARRPRGTLTERYHASAYFDTRGSYEQATSAMTSKFKSNLRRRNRLAESSGPLRFQSCRSQSDLEPAFQSFLDIEGSGWKGPTGTASAILCRPRVLAFYGAMVREFGARGECVINLLWHGDQPVAAQLGLHIGRTLHILKVGYRDENSIFAPGILLQERTLRHACEDATVDVLSMVNDPYWARSFRPQTVGVCVYCTPNWTLRGLLTIVGLLAKRFARGLFPQAAASRAEED